MSVARKSRFGARLGVEELEERIAPALAAFGGAALVGTTATLSAHGQGITLTEADGDVWNIAMSATDANLAGGDIVLEFSNGANVAGNTALWTIDFGNGALLPDNADVSLLFQLQTTAGDGLLNFDAAGADIVSTNAGFVASFGGVTNNLTAATPLPAAVALNADVSARLDFGASTVVSGASTFDAVSVGRLSGAIGAASIVQITSSAAHTSGNLGAITLTGGANVTSITAGGDFGGLISGNNNLGTLTVGGDSGALNLGTGEATGTWSVGGDVASITADQILGNVTVGGDLGAVTVGSAAADDIAGNISVGGDFTGGITMANGGDLTGNLVVTGDLTGAIALTGGNITGNITVSGNNGITANITAADINSTIQARGIAANITATAGSIAGTITTTATGIGNVTASNNVTATINAAITGAPGVADLGNVTATTGNISGAITSGGDMGNLAAGGQISSAITSGGDIGSITAANGITAAGVIKAADDITGAITIAAGGMAGTIEAGSDTTGSFTALGASAITGNFTGTIKAADHMIGAGITFNSTTWSGTIQTTNGDILVDIDNSASATDMTGTISAGRDLGGDVLSGGAITNPIVAGRDIVGPVTISTAGDGNLAGVTVGRDIDDTGGAVNILSEGNIAFVNATGSIGFGAAGVTIQADSDAGAGETGSIGANTAGVLSGVTAGDGIDATILANSGTIFLVQSGGNAGEDIDGIITAEDLVLVNAGAGRVNAVVTATDAVATSPLYTVISDGFSYGVWVFQPGTTTPLANATAQVVYTGGVVPGIAITNLNTGGAAADIAVLTRLSTGNQQQVTDTDVTVIDAPVNVTAIAALSNVSVGAVNIDVEGSLNLAAVTLLNVISTQIEGGITGGTLTGAPQMSFGAIDGNVIIAGNVGILSLFGNAAGDAITAGNTLTINGNITTLVLGASGLGTTGNLAGALVVNGIVGQIIVQGAVTGNITAQDFTGVIDITGNLNANVTATNGDIPGVTVDGNIGNAGAMAITATGGDIGVISAGGTLGAGGVVTITAAAVAGVGGDITTVTSVGAMGAGGAAVITADGAIGSVSTTGTGSNLTAVILARGGDVGSVTSVNGALAGAVTSNVGDIGVVAVLDVDGNFGGSAAAGNAMAITAPGGDVDIVAAGAGGITGNTVARLGVTGSPVTTWYTGFVASTLFAFDGDINTPAQAIFNYTFTGATNSINMTIDNWNNAAGAAYDTNLGVMLTTTTLDVDGVTVIQDNMQFDLDGLDFDADSVANGANNLDLLKIEGGIPAGGPGLDLGIGGTLGTLLIEGGVGQSILAAGVTVVSVGDALGVNNPTAAQIQGLFTNPGGGAVTFAAPADGTITGVPVSANSPGQTVSFTYGDGTGLVDPTVLASQTVQTYDITITGGVITAIVSVQGGGAVPGGNVVLPGDLGHVFTAIDINNFTVNGSILATGGLLVNDVNNITIGTAGDLTSGDMAGTITVIANPGFALAGNAANITILGTLSGSIYVQNNAASVTLGQVQISGDTGAVLAEAGGMAAGAEIIIGGNVAANIIANSGDLGVDGANPGLILVGGSVIGGNIQAVRGAVNADIFVGGNAGDALNIQGVGAISSRIAAGAANGINTLTLTIDEVINDPNPVVYTAALTVGDMLVEIDRGAVDTDAATIAQITLIDNGAVQALNVTAAGADRIDVAQVLSMTAEAGLTINVSGNLGDVLVAEGSSIAPSTQSVLDEFTANYDELFTQATALNASLFNDGPVDLNATLFLSAQNIGSVVVDGNLGIQAGANTIGDLVSLNGDLFTVGTDVHAATAIGSLVASGDINGVFISEGTLALGAAGQQSLSARLDAMYGAAIGNYVPDWFVAGILSEAGDIVGGSEFRAAGGFEVVGGFPVPVGVAMGRTYVMSGNVGAALFTGNSLGFWVPMGQFTATINANTVVDLVVPNFAGVFNGVVTGIEAINGEAIVSAGNAYRRGNVTVTPGAGVLVIVTDAAAGDGTIDALLVLGLDGAGTTLDIAGDVDLLTINSDWAGTVNVIGTIDGINGEADGVVDDIFVNGNILASADLNAANFNTLLVNGTIDAAVTDSGTIDRTNRVAEITAANSLSGAGQSLYLFQGRRVSADWTSVFGKITDIQLSGRGKAGLVSVDGTGHAERDLRAIARAGVVNEGSANVGDISVARGSNVRLNRVVVGGSAGEIGGMNVNAINRLFVTGDVDTVQALRINNAFVGGDVNSVMAQNRLDRLTVEGDAGTIQGTQINNAYVGGTTNTLSMSRMFNSTFAGPVTNWNALARISRSSVNGVPFGLVRQV